MTKVAFGRKKVSNSSGCCFQGVGGVLYVLKKISTNMQLDKYSWCAVSPVLLLTEQHELGLPSFDFDGRGWQGCDKASTPRGTGGKIICPRAPRRLPGPAGS